jgi:hypothetical protein
MSVECVKLARSLAFLGVRPSATVIRLRSPAPVGISNEGASKHEVKNGARRAGHGICRRPRRAVRKRCSSELGRLRRRLYLDLYHLARAQSRATHLHMDLGEAIKALEIAVPVAEAILLLGTPVKAALDPRSLNSRRCVNPPEP